MNEVTDSISEKLGTRDVRNGRLGSRSICRGILHPHGCRIVDDCLLNLAYQGSSTISSITKMSMLVTLLICVPTYHVASPYADKTV